MDDLFFMIMIQLFSEKVDIHIDHVRFRVEVYVPNIQSDVGS